MADAPPASRRFTPTPVETSTKKVRRFAVEPVETTRSSVKRDAAPKEDEVDRKDFQQPVPAVTTKRRFAPEPVETTFKSSKQVKELPTPERTPDKTEDVKREVPRVQLVPETPTPRRRFVPELIETTKRSKKAGDLRPATLPTDKTDLTPGVPNIYTRPKRKSRPPVAPIPPENTPNVSSANLQTQSHIPPLPPRRQGSMRPHPNTRRSTRQNSFQPELDTIPSELHEGSDEEDDYEGTPSLSGSLGSSEDSLMRLQLARTRESCDDRFSGYLLSLAAKAAEKQLREQALAAFPNESMHEIVEHFYDREIEGQSDNDSVEGVGLLIGSHMDIEDPILRRKSTEVGWAAKEMQEHQEKLNRLREDETNVKIAAEATVPSFKDPFWTNGMTVKTSQPVDAKKEAEMEKMRSAASPPMLGADLEFRMCPSPKATKFESDQRIDVQPNRCENGGGLWGGYCVSKEPDQYLSPAIKQTPMIQTPTVEKSDPFSSAFAAELPKTPSGARSPSGSKSPTGARSPRGSGGGPRMLFGIEERLKSEIARSKAEEALFKEFDDTFVTQVYNYLSLGYPSLAWQYDEELSKISRLAVEDLRKDDRLTTSVKGHIGIEKERNINGVKSPAKGGGEEKKCARWRALRIYILEWGRQNPNMSNGAMGPSAWGVRARRGSWAI